MLKPSQAPIVAAEVRDGSCAASPLRLVLAAVVCALGGCALLYAATALAGAACYGRGVRADVLANLGDATAGGDPLAALAGGAAGLKWGRPSLTTAPHEPLRLLWRLLLRLSNPTQLLGS